MGATDGFEPSSDVVQLVSNGVPLATGWRISIGGKNGSEAGPVAAGLVIKEAQTSLVVCVWGGAGEEAVSFWIYFENGVDRICKSLGCGIFFLKKGE